MSRTPKVTGSTMYTRKAGGPDVGVMEGQM
jgi:hypothetical protein